MIPKQEILLIAVATNVLPSTVEKDYILSWTLEAFAKPAEERPMHLINACTFRIYKH